MSFRIFTSAQRFLEEFFLLYPPEDSNVAEQQLELLEDLNLFGENNVVIVPDLGQPEGSDLPPQYISPYDPNFDFSILTPEIEGVSFLPFELFQTLVSGPAEEVFDNFEEFQEPDFDPDFDLTPPLAPLVNTLSLDSGRFNDDRLTNDPTLVIRGTAENNATIVIFINGVAVGTTQANGSGNWAFDYTGTVLEDGDYDLSARAIDAAGNISPLSGNFGFTIDTEVEAPVVEGVSDDTGESDADGITFDRTLIFRGKAEANSDVEIFVNDVSQGIVRADEDGNWVFNNTENSLADGEYSITARAVDVAGNISEESDSFAITVDNVVEPPVFGRLFNDTGFSNRDEVTNDPSLVFAGLAEANSQVELFLVRAGGDDEPIRLTRDRDTFEGPSIGESIGKVTANDQGLFVFDYREVELPEGEYILTGQVTDVAGNISDFSEGFSFEIDTTPPVEPRVTRIFNDTGESNRDGVTADPEIVIAGVAEANSRVFVYLDGEQIGTTFANGAGLWFFNHTQTTLEDGRYDITARSQDRAGNLSDESDPYDIRIDTVAPEAPAIFRLINDTGVSSRDEITNDSSLIFIGFAEPRTDVEIFINGESAGSVEATFLGLWFFDHREANLPDGNYTITARATDRAGNVSDASQPFAVTVDTVAPEAPSIELVREDDFLEDDFIFEGPRLDGPFDGEGPGFFPLPPLGDGDRPGPDNGIEYTSDNTLSFRGSGEPGTFIALYLVPGQEGPGGEPEVIRILDQEPRETRLGVVRVNEEGVWSINLDEPFEDGAYKIAVESIDVAGNVSPRSYIDVTVDTIPPEAPLITGLQEDTGRDDEDGITSDPSPAIVGQAEPFSLVEVLLEEGEEGQRFLGVVQANEEGQWRLDYNGEPLGDGDYQILARARDFANNISEQSVPFEVNIDTIAPAAPSFRRIRNDTGRSSRDEVTRDETLEIIGKAEAGSLVQIYLGEGEGQGNLIGTAEANENGRFRFEYETALDDGTYELRFLSVDAAGNESPLSQSTQVIIDTEAPLAPTLELVREDQIILEGPLDLGDQEPLQNPFLNQEDQNFDNRLEYTRDNTVTVEGYAEPGSRVLLFLDGKRIARIDTQEDGSWSYSLDEPLDDASYAFSVRAVDRAGNRSEDSEILNVIVDTVAPEAPVILGIDQDTGAGESDGVTSDSAPTLFGQAEPGSLVEVFFGEDHFAGRVLVDNKGDWRLEYQGENPLEDGAYGVRAIAIDRAGNRSDLSDLFPIQIDTEAPEAPVVEKIAIDTGVSAEDGITSNNRLSFAGKAEPNSRVELFMNQASIGVTMADENGNWNIDYTGTTLADGDYSLHARSTDLAGNESLDSAVKALVVDTKGPEAPIITGISEDTGIPGDGITNDQSLLINGTAEANSILNVFVNGAPVGQTNADEEGNWQYDYTAVSLADNAYNFSAQAVDLAGNFGPLSSVFSATIDTAPPAIPVIDRFSEDSGQEGDGITSDNQLVFEGSADLASTVILVLNEEEIGRAKTDEEGRWQFDHSEVELPDGPYRLRVIAEDIAGNQSEASEPLDFVVDTVAPEAPSIESLSEDSGLSDSDGITSDNTPSVRGQAEPESTVNVFLNGALLGTIQADEEGYWELPYEGQPLEDGAYSLTATATDAAGNISEVSEISPLQVDTVAPQIPTVYLQAGQEDRDNEEPALALFEIEGPIGGDDDEVPSLSDKTPSFAGEAEAGSTVVILIDGEEVGRAISNPEGQWFFSLDPEESPLEEPQLNLNEGPIPEEPQFGLSEGRHDVEVFSIDLAGNESPQSLPVGFIVDTIAPEAPQILGISDDTGSSEVDGITSDNSPRIFGRAEPGSQVEVFLDGDRLGYAAADPEGGWSLAYEGPPLEDGLYNITAVAEDRAGNVSVESEGYSLTIDISPPPAPLVTGISSDRGLSGKDGITSDNTLNIKGEGEIGATVEVFLNGESIGTKKVNSKGRWNLNHRKTTLEDGNYIVTALAVSPAGLVGPLSDEFLIQIDTVAPDATDIRLSEASDSGVSDADGITSDNRPDLEGIAEPGSRIQIFQDGKSVGKVLADENGHWEFGMRRLSDGSYTLTAIVQDIAGNKSDSSSEFNLVVDTAAPEAPTLELVRDQEGPEEGGEPFLLGNLLVDLEEQGSNDGVNYVPTGLFALRGTAEPDSLVDLYFGEELVATVRADEEGNWQYRPEEPFDDGSYDFTANSRDAAGNVSPASLPLAIVVDTIAPAVPSISGVSSGSESLALDGITSDTTPTLFGTAEPHGYIEVFLGQESVGRVKADADGNWQLGLVEDPLADGSYSLFVQQIDLAGNKSPISEAFALNIDTEAPEPPVITHISDDTETLSVDHIVNGNFEAGKEGWTFLNNESEVRFPARTYGLSNEGHGSIVSEMIADSPVTLSQNLTNLIFGENYTLSFDAALRNNAEAGDGLRVVWNGITVFDETGESALIKDWQTFNLNLTAGSGDGSDTLEFIGLSGNSGDSRGAVLDNVSFVGLALDSTDGVTSDNTLAINGTAEAGSEVEVFLDGNSLGSTIADDQGRWRFDNSENVLENGSYEVTALARDAADNASPVSEAYNLTVNTPPIEFSMPASFGAENNTFEWDSAALLDLSSLANGENGPYRTVDLSVNEGSVSLNLNEVLDASGPNNYLVIDGDADNVVEIEDDQGWSLVQTGFNEGGNVYNVYTNGEATLQIDQSIVVV